MEKLRLFNRPLRLSDVNNIVNTINQIIDKIDKPINIQEIEYTDVVKDYYFFKWEETPLPFDEEFTLTSVEDLDLLLHRFNIDLETVKWIEWLLNKWIYVKLWIHIEEDISEKDKKQEVMFETIKTKPIDKVEKKKIVKKKPTKKKTK